MRVALDEYSIEALNNKVNDHIDNDRVEIKLAIGNSSFIRRKNKLNIVILIMAEMRRIYKI
jgi:hypothetical protein